MYIMNIICGCMLCQHALGDCAIKLESNSFRTLLSAGYNSVQVLMQLKTQAKSAVCRQSQSQKAPNSAQIFCKSESTALLCICNRLHRKQKFAD